MEINVFHEPAVAGRLSRNYVEARIHTDHLDDEIRERNLALQQKLQGSLGLPFYVLMDPATERVFDTHAGATLTAAFQEFLDRGIDGVKTGPRVANASH